MAIFTGAGVAIVTPFREDGSVDYDSLDRLIDFHCENGTDSIVICGTSGEAATLTEEEHMKCVKFTVERTKGRIPVIAGTGSIVRQLQWHFLRKQQVMVQTGFL